MYSVTVQPSGFSFVVKENETVLEAALRCGYFFPHHCRMGVCATCRGRVLAGEIDYDGLEILGLTHSEKKAGYALFCSAKPKSDLTIHVDDFANTKAPEPKQLTYNVIHHELLAKNISQIILQAPANTQIHYQAGQYIEVLQDDVNSSPMSIACAPYDISVIELHLYHPQKNSSAQALLDLVNNKKQLTLRGPFGKCTADKIALDRPIIFMARGTGFAPIKAVMEELLQIKNLPPIYFYWRAESSEYLYFDSLIQEWTHELPRFSYTPIFENALVQTILDNHADLTHYQVYAVDSQNAVYAALFKFMDKGLSKEWFYSDVL